MNKTKIIQCLLLIVGLTACQEFQPVFTGKYDNPEVYEPVEMVANCSIADLAKRYRTGQPWTIDEDIVISGIVSTTDQPGNFYKSFYIQDETGGMEIKMGKNGLYNDYQPGQRVFVDCNGLCLGMYGYKSSQGNGMVQVGYSNPTGEYETSYLESPIIIDTHVYRGKVEGEVTPVVLQERDLPGTNATQATNGNIGKLVTVKNLTYTWYDSSYGGSWESAFALLYIDNNADKDASSNKIFISGDDNCGRTITTWAMSKEKMNEMLLSGKWDSAKIGNGNDMNYGTVGDRKGDGTYPDIDRSAASVSQYFKTPEGYCIQLRTSGYSKFSDYEIPADVLSGEKAINITGILAMYQGKVQMVVNRLEDITYADGSKLYK